MSRLIRASVADLGAAVGWPLPACLPACLPLAAVRGRGGSTNRGLTGLGRALALGMIFYVLVLFALDQWKLLDPQSMVPFALHGQRA